MFVPNIYAFCYCRNNFNKITHPEKIMGISLCKDKIKPAEINDVRKFYGRSDSETSDNFQTKRTTTDVHCLLFMTTFLIILLCFVAYCIVYGDIFRIINGYDNCGNVCGKTNPIRHDNIRRDECLVDSSKINQPFHIMSKRNDTNIMDRKCVSNCSDYEGYRVFFNRCVQKRTRKVVNTFFSKTGIQNFFQEVSEDFYLCWKEFIYICLIALGLSIILLVLLRFLAGLVVWLVLISVTVACIISSILLWIMWRRSRDLSSYNNNLTSDVDSRKTSTYLIFAVVATIITVVVILILIVMRKRIRLVVQLFKEAGKAIIAMPLILFEPFLSFISLFFVISLWFYFTIWIESAGLLTEKRSTHVYYYEKDNWIKVSRWYNLFAMLWMVQFIIACQHMIIAGAVSDWYFTRNKSASSSFIYKSGYNLIRYHLGSVALGSFLIALVQLLRVILKAIEKYLHNHQGKCIECVLKCCQCCLYCFENILKYLNRNAYIEIAIYGYSFCRASKQAFKILTSNILRVSTVNSVGDFVLFLSKVLVVIATILLGIEILRNKEGLQHLWVPIMLAGLFAYFVSHCFISIYEMAIDTIFLCFCEDCEQNDGILKPYYMSRDLMEFVENSKKSLQFYDVQKNQQAFEQNVSTISYPTDKRI